MPFLIFIMQVEPSGMELLQQEIIKAIPGATLTAFGALLALVVGKRVAAYWAFREKRRELELATLNSFYGLYGEFFCLWKVWNQHFANKPESDDVGTTKWSILERASRAESQLESILVKVASERSLSEQDIEKLGLFRQAFQTIRSNIRDSKPIEWSTSDHPKYQSFKRLACFVSRMLLSNVSYSEPSAEVAADQLSRITCNEHEARWDAIGVDATRNLKRLPPRPQQD